MPCPIATGKPSSPSRSSVSPSTVGMKQLSAIRPRGLGRPAANASAYDITPPCEKPPITVRSIGTGSESRKSEASAKARSKVSLSG